MGKIDLGREHGVRTTDAPTGGQDFNGYSRVQAGVSDMARATDSLARGMAHLGKVFGDISHDMAATRNAVDFSDYRVQSFKIDKENFRDKMEADMLSGAINSRESFDAAFKKYSAIAAQKRAEFVKKAGYAPEVLDKIEINDKREELRNYAELTGSFIKAENKRIWETTENNIKEFAENGSISDAKGVLSNISVLADNLKGRYSEDVIGKLKREGAKTYFASVAKKVSGIENDADRQRLIDMQVEVLAQASEDGAASLGIDSLSKYDIEMLRSSFSQQSKQNEADIAKKNKISTGERIAEIVNAQGKERDERIKTFEKFLGECKYLSAEDKMEARTKLDKLLAAEKAKTDKAKNDALKLQNLNFKTRTRDLFAGQAEVSVDEAATVERIRNAAKSAFTAPDKDGNGKIVVSVEDKKHGYIAKLRDAIDAYDEDADESGIYARALLYQLDAVFTDEQGEEGRIYAPEEEARLRRELGEHLGIFAKANIKAESVKEYVAPIFGDAIEMKFSKLTAAQRLIFTQLKQAFVRTAMTAGLNDERELGQWINKSEYVATLREKLKLLKDVSNPRDFDTDFAYAESRIDNAPNLAAYARADMEMADMEAAYLKMKSKRNEKLSKEDEE